MGNETLEELAERLGSGYLGKLDVFPFTAAAWERVKDFMVQFAKDAHDYVESNIEEEEVLAWFDGGIE